MQEQNDLLQFQGRLCHLANQVEEMQWEVARLVKENQTGNTTMKALVHHLLHSKNQQQVLEHLSEFRTQQEENQERLDEFAKTVKKLSRTQFKANTLNESKEQQTNETIALLRELATKREATSQARKREEQEHLNQLQATARGEFVADFLPVLDGIEMALSHNIAPMKDRDGPSLIEKEPEHSGGLFKKLFGDSSPSPETFLQEENLRLTQDIRDIHEAIRTWGRGLEIVRDRCLRLLAAEGIKTIPDLGEPFNPHLHVAVETEICHGVPDNTIVKVIRKGYTHRERVLRYSEVIVAKVPETERGDQHKDE